MSDRERWIVYPLLLLALGASLRNKLTKTVETERIRVSEVLNAEQIQCRRLVLLNDQDKPLMVLGSKQGGTYAQIEGIVLAERLRCQELAIVDRNGQRCMTLDVKYFKKKDKPEILPSGRMVLFGANNKPLMGLGANADGTYGVIEAKQGVLKINGPVLAKTMQCEELAIVGKNQGRCMTLDVAYEKNPDGSPGELRGGRLQIHDNDGKVVGVMVPGGDGRSCEILTQRTDGEPQVSISSTPAGGKITIFDDAGNLVVVGHTQDNDKRVAGLFTVGSDGKIKTFGTTFKAEISPKKKEEEKENDQ